jgi:hypothetical protein
MIASENAELDGIGQMAPSYVVAKVYDSANPDIVVASAEVTARTGSSSYTARSGSDGIVVIPVEGAKGTSFEVTAQSPSYESVGPATMTSQGHKYWEYSNVVPAQKIDVGPIRTPSYSAPRPPASTYAPAPGVKVAPYVLNRDPVTRQAVMIGRNDNLTTYIVVGGAAVLVLGIGILFMVRK